MYSDPPLKVLSIAHTAVRREIGRLRYHPFQSRRDLDVHLVVPQRWHEFGHTMDADAPDDPGVTIHILPIRMARAGPLGWYLHFYPGLRALIQRLRPDVIHLWEEPWSVVGLQAACLKGDAALVMEVDQNILKILPPPFETIRRHVLRKTVHVLVRSPDASRVVRASGYAGPVSPIGYGIDQRIFNVSGGPLWTGVQPLRLGYVGRLIEEKGLDDALEGMACAAAPCSFAIMGDGPYEARLRRRIGELGIEARVTIQGWSSPKEVAGFMRGLDALMLLTRTTKSVREQFGRVIIEAQSCGVPVIGSDCGAIPTVLGPGGWVVPERDPRALADLIDRLASDRREMKARGLAGQKNVAVRFTYEAVATALADAWIAASGQIRLQDYEHRDVLSTSS